MTDPISTQYLARFHQTDLLREAEHQRRVTAARGARPGAWQHMLRGTGAATIAFGRWLQAHAQSAARESRPASVIPLGDH